MAEMTMMIVTTLLAVKLSGAIPILRVTMPGGAAAIDAGGSDAESGRGFMLEGHSLQVGLRSTRVPC
jgi:hypothetical protein